MHETKFQRLLVSVAALLFAGLATSAVQAQTGSITGRVTAAGPAANPLEAARVTVVGTNLGASTTREGVYTIRGVPAGTYTVRAIRLGYAQREQSVTVGAGEAATVDFSLTEAPFTLEEITTTATGEARKLEVGNTINTIQVAPLVEQGPIRDVSQILAARAPAVQVLPSSGTIGTGQRIRIRGNNSVSLSNEPLFVIDGIRVNTAVGDQSFGVGGQSASRLHDINPEEIADIQILKGPSASAVYGTGGSNGVILITTKRGVAGRAQWNTWAEVGSLQDATDYPDNYWGSRVTATPAGADRCLLIQQAAGTCTIATIFTFNPMLNPETSPIQTGLRRQLGGSVSGGTDAVRYFVSTEWEGEDGVFKMPGAEEERILESSGRPELRIDEVIPNFRNKWNLRANTNFTVSPKVNGAVNIGYVNSNTRFPQNDNNVLGILSSGLNGDGRAGLEGNIPGTSTPYSALQWGFFRPGETFQRLTVQIIDRVTMSATGNYTPFTWLTTRGTVGADVTNRGERQVQRFGEGANFGTQRLGFAGEARVKQALYTADVGGTANFQLTDRVSSKTSGGFQYSENNFHGTNANGDLLPPSGTSIGFTSIRRISEGTTVFKTAGGYVEQVFGLDDRLFVTGSLRFDKNSSTGVEARTIVYPKAAASWLTPWFDQGSLSSLRLRASYGEAGQQPTGLAALETFFGTQAAVGAADVPAVGLNNFGDPTLKTERSREIEAGFDLGMFDGRVAVEFTGFHKSTHDALIFVTEPPSLGNPSGQFRNVGRTRNQGLELVVNAQVLSQTNLSWDFTLTGALLRSRLLDMPPRIPFISQNTNNTQQHRACIPDGPCYPLGGYWERPYTFEDANGDGIIVRSEMTVGDTLEFIGPSQPTRQMTFNTVVGLLNNRLQLSTTLDYNGGHYLWNLMEDFRCAARANCLAAYDQNASLEEQARFVGRTQFGALNTTFGYIEKADFLKWRELSATFNAPASWAAAVRADRLSITATGRNLATITDYTGLDPEVNGQGEGNFTQREFLSLPPLRQFALRVNLTF